jgi:uncharacterized protein (DUF427 family)
MHRRSGRRADEQEFGPADPDVVAAEPTPKRVRARLDDAWILDSDRALIAWIEGPTPTYAIPSDDVDVKLDPEPARSDERLGEVEGLALVVDGNRLKAAGVRVLDAPTSAQRLQGHVVLDWEVPDAWYVEDERQRGHPRDPYHRIDVHRTSRPVTVEAGGQSLAETTRALAVVETGLPIRFYIPRVDVAMEHLGPSPTETVCAYKGQAEYFHVDLDGQRVEDAAWSYPSPEPRFGRLQDLVCFDQEKVDLEVADTELR